MQMGVGGEISTRLWRQNEMLQRETQPSFVLEFNYLSDDRYKEQAGKTPTRLWRQNETRGREWAERYPLDFGAKMRYFKGKLDHHWC